METTLPENLDALRQERAALEAEHQVLALRLKNNTLRAANGERLRESWGDFISPREYLDGDRDFFAGQSLVTQPSRIDDRREGRNYPIFQTDQELNQIRGDARLLCQKSTAAIGVLTNLVNYCIGNGLTVEVVPKARSRRRGKAEVSDDLLDLSQDVLDDFFERNAWCGDLERELFCRSKRDGEYLLALYHVGGGRVEAREVEPECLLTPAQADQLDRQYGFDHAPSSWLFGVHTELDDVQRVHGYYVQWTNNPADYDYLPAAWGASGQLVQHMKLNVDRNIKRGLSDFYAGSELLQDSAKLLKNMARGAQVQAAIAYIEEYPAGVSKSTANSQVEDSADFSFQRATPAGNTKTVSKRHLGPGTALKVSTGKQYKEGPGAKNAPGFELVNQAVMRIAGMRWAMPEYMISGDASNANFSSTMVSESPWVKACEAEQSRYKAGYRRIMWQVLEAAFLAGRLRHLNVTWQELRQVIDIQIEAPAVAARNKLEETNRRVLLRDKGLLSGKTMTSEEGYDYEQEQANLREEAPPTPSLVAGVMQKVLGQPNTNPARNQDEPAEPVAEPVAESIGAAVPPAVRAAIATTLKEWRTP